jgi:hypothetical protein
MSTKRLIATKSYRYATRRLQAGDEFEASGVLARALVGARKANYAPDQAPRPPEPAPPVQAEETAEAVETEAENMPPFAPGNIDSLRARAARLGITVDGRWGVARLLHEIGQAQRG